MKLIQRWFHSAWDGIFSLLSLFIYLFIFNWGQDFMVVWYKLLRIMNGALKEKQNCVLGFCKSRRAYKWAIYKGLPTNSGIISNLKETTKLQFENFLKPNRTLYYLVERSHASSSKWDAGSSGNTDMQNKHLHYLYICHKLIRCSGSYNTDMQNNHTLIDSHLWWCILLFINFFFAMSII